MHKTTSMDNLRPKFCKIVFVMRAGIENLSI